jgi:hypothetical protein
MATRTRGMEPLFVHNLGPIRTQTQDFSNYQWLHYIELIICSYMNELKSGRGGGAATAAGVMHSDKGSVIQY